ncbi:hypothetical protein [uncultured Ferrimonas sp.]|uniref:hypothetical protein n=1 Tax=uncultured Ferrimonas sp. TaxID=432640 RepID=UPI00260E2272|nr:hypothetical protein [uncultured Ferrimonas sp.]
MAKKDKDNKKAAKLLLKAVKKQLEKQLKQGVDLTEFDKSQCEQLASDFVAGLNQAPAEPTRHHFPHHGIVLTKPWKGKPCKNCPALDGHLCKCALKQAKRVRLGLER